MGYHKRKSGRPGKRDPKFGDPDFKSNFASSSATGPIGEGEVKDAIAVLARRNLQFGSVQVKADPYTAALPGSEPYPMIAKFNTVLSPTYKGDANLDGGNIQQYSYSVTSRYLKAFDYMYMRLNANYNYLPMTAADARGDMYPGKLLIDEQRKAISEACSIMQATTFTNLAINSYAIETDLPMGSATPTTVTISSTNEDKAIYTDLTDVLYAFSTFYQLVLQACKMTVSTYNSFRLKMGTMLRTAFNREVPQLNSLFGLYKKKAFLTLLSGVASNLEGEYFDTTFAKTADILSVTPSRRSNSMFDPVLELGLGLSHPSVFKIHIMNTDGTATVGDPIDLMDMISVDEISGWENDGEPFSLFNIQVLLQNQLNAEDTVRWARSTQYSEVSANERFNSTKYLYDAVNTIMTRFKIYVSDLREALDVMSRAGIVQWSKGFVPHITDKDDAPLCEYRFVSDVFKAAMSSATTVSFNTRTKRWDTFTIWNMYDGVPLYDTMSGGAFLTFSFKQFSTPDGDADSTIGYVPKVFSGQKDGTYDVYAYMVSRDGSEFKIHRGGETVIAESPILNRLAPLSSQSQEKIRIPTVYVPKTLPGYDSYVSLAYKVLSQVFSCAEIKVTETEDISSEVQFSDIALDPDIISIYQIELEDISDEARTYARSKCLVRGSAKDPGTIGFQHT